MKNQDPQIRNAAIEAFAKADLDLDSDFEKGAVERLTDLPFAPMPDREALIMQGAETMDSGLILEQERK